MAIEQILTIEFGKDGQSEDHVGVGWSPAEVAHRWMIGASSELTLGPVVAGGSYLLILDIEPFIRARVLRCQRLTISINGIPFVQTGLTAGGKFGYRIPPHLVAADGELRLVFDHPDAARPSDLFHSDDQRRLAISVNRVELHRVSGSLDPSIVAGRGGILPSDVERRTNLAPDQLMARFESLGENCEFGLAQRRSGSEPLSLLRFANTLLPNLLQGLRSGFDGLGSADDLTFRLEGKTQQEYIVQERRYGLVYHTFRYKGEIDEAKFVASEVVRLQFLVRKFIEDLRAGEKIFICKRNNPLQEVEILPLLTAINAYGQNTLFWIVLADGTHPAGSVHWVMPGLLKGYIDRFAPNENAHDLSLDVWLELCVHAFELRRKKFGA